MGMIKRMYEALTSLPKAVFENPIFEDLEEDSQQMNNPDDEVPDDDYSNPRIH